jgi:hypothetical protein
VMTIIAAFLSSMEISFIKTESRVR